MHREGGALRADTLAYPALQQEFDAFALFLEITSASACRSRLSE